jgi:glycosyltransferase involved in cell wall biosynthesis
MIIGIDASRANYDQKTGVEWYARHIIQELKTLVSSSDRVVLYSDEPLKGELAILPSNFESRVLRWPPKRFWTQIRLSWEMVRRPPDVLFVPAHVLPLIHPKKTVLTIHDVAGAYFPKAYNWFERWYSIFAAKQAVRSKSEIVIPTAHVKQDIIRLLGDSAIEKHITVIPHGVDASFGVPHSEEQKKLVRTKYKLPNSFILFTGRLEEKKNVTGLVRAYSAFREKYPEQKEALVLVGKPGFGYEEVQKEIAASPYRQDIFEPGWVSSEDLPVLLQSARAFVFLSWYEGFGIPLLEAFQSQVPVLSSDRSCLPEVGGNACLFVDPSKETEICDALYAILTNEDMRKSLVEKGAKRVQEFSWKKSAKMSLDVIHKVEDST